MMDDKRIQMQTCYLENERVLPLHRDLNRTLHVESIHLKARAKYNFQL